MHRRADRGGNAAYLRLVFDFGDHAHGGACRACIEGCCNPAQSGNSYNRHHNA